MDKKEIMKHIVGNDSDDEIKWEFYHEIIYSQFKVCSLWTDSYDKTNLVETTTDMDGNKTSYGYDTYDDTLLQITTTVNNEVNSNTLNYTGNLLTGLLHNDIEINFTYDGFGNQTGVSLAGVDYLETEYQDIMGPQTLEDGSTLNVVIGKKATTTNALQEKFITYTDLDGNITQIDFVDKNNISSTMLKNSYDGYGNLTGTLDNDLNSETLVEYDEYARVISKSYTSSNFESLSTQFTIFSNISSFPREPRR